MRTTVQIALLLSLIVSLASAHSAEADAVPWGVSSSASSFRNSAEWLPKMSAAGVSWVRLFPEWRGFEPKQGQWQWEKADAFVKAAAENKIQINAILMGCVPWSKAKGHAFPMKNLDDWATYVSTVVEHYKGQVRIWEVWNEGNAGFNDDHSTTTDYASLAATAYAAAKKSDPNAQVGLTVASFDAPYLHQAILAQAKMGKAGSFDFLCIHPYEVADGVGVYPGGEVPYLWMTRTLRDMLKISALDRVNTDIWVTEIGRRIEKRNGKEISEKDAAKTLVKLYVMSSAQGIKHTLWFEAQDPVGEDQGFGLLSRDGKPRATHTAFKTMTTVLGATPMYLGWLALGAGGRGFGFVFQGAEKPVLAAWMPSEETDETIAFTGDVDIVDAVTGTSAPLKSGQPITLTDSPIFVIGLPADLVAQAQANAAKNYPWGGDYSADKTVSIQLGTADGSHGVVQVGGGKATPAYTYPNGSTGIQIKNNQPASFYVHPSFASFQTNDYYIRMTLRRLGKGNVGMNCFYEVADSQGKSAYKSTGSWYSLPEGDDWQTQVWHVTGACFSKIWNYDISFRPEKSVPFVIGKVEVSTVPFETHAK